MIPPIAGIMVVDYFVLRTYRKALDESREKGTLPSEPEKLNPVTLVAWAAGFASGYFITVGIPSINSLLISGIIYYAGVLLIKSIKGKKENRDHIAS